MIRATTKPTPTAISPFSVGPAPVAANQSYERTPDQLQGQVL